MRDARTSTPGVRRRVVSEDVEWCVAKASVVHQRSVIVSTRAKEALAARKGHTVHVCLRNAEVTRGGCLTEVVEEKHTR